MLRARESLSPVKRERYLDTNADSHQFSGEKK